MSEGKTSDKNIVLYLSLWFNAFKELNQGISKEELMRRIQELEEKIRKMMEENEELRRRLLSGISSFAFLYNYYSFHVVLEFLETKIIVVCTYLIRN